MDYSRTITNISVNLHIYLFYCTFVTRYAECKGRYL